MKKEVLHAVNFLVDMLRINSAVLTEEQLLKFRKHAYECLWQHYQDHWFPEAPMKGSGYRCIRINGKMDPLIARAGALVGLASGSLRSLFPSELTMWIDPSEVAYRIGENGSICNLYVQLSNNPSSSSSSSSTSAPDKKLKEEPSPVKAAPPKHQPPSSPQLTIQQIKQQQQQQQQQQQHKVNAPPTQLGRCYRAIYDYEAADTDEVSFRDGDLLTNCTSIDEGWMMGTVQRTGRMGMLPANYVERAA